MLTQDLKEIEILREGGRILAAVLNLVASKVVPGVSAKELDELAEAEILKAGGTPSFKNYRAQAGDPPFPASLCVSRNFEVVHGIPATDKILRSGDIVGLDLGLYFEGLYTDMAITVPVGRVSREHLKLIDAAAKSLEAGISEVKAENYTGDIGFAIESTARKYGFSVVRELVGHGVGRKVHEEPEVPCFGKPKTGTKLAAGMVLALEPMLNEGNWKINFAADGWTIITEDKSWSAHMEHTVIVTEKGCEIVTQ